MSDFYQMPENGSSLPKARFYLVNDSSYENSIKPSNSHICGQNRHITDISKSVRCVCGVFKEIGTNCNWCQK